jgi:hypothetical protein
MRRCFVPTSPCRRGRCFDCKKKQSFQISPFQRNARGDLSVVRELQVALVDYLVTICGSFWGRAMLVSLNPLFGQHLVSPLALWDVPFLDRRSNLARSVPTNPLVDRRLHADGHSAAHQLRRRPRVGRRGLPLQTRL